MKRVDNIFEKIISVENLQKADEMARKGKKSTYGVKVHDRCRDGNILRLHELLRTGQYRTSGSDNLMEMIQKVPRDNFPFETIIKKRDNKRIEFT